MPAHALALTIAAYAALALLLLGLNLGSLWRWPIKAASTIATTGVFVGAWFAINGLLGWPIADRLPERASFLASRIVEPDAASGAPGAIFVWLQPVDAINLPQGAPRAYELRYDRAVAEQVIEAQRLRFSGRDVLGVFDYDAEPSEEAAPPADPAGDQKTADAGDAEAGGAGGGSMFSLDQNLHASFAEMPPLALPDKAPNVVESY